jgi:hypothetical protein
MTRCGKHPEITEIWTISRQVVVLSGSHTVLTRVAARLGVDSDEIVEAAPTLSALGLWGEALDDYRRFGAGPAVVTRRLTRFADRHG